MHFITHTLEHASVHTPHTSAASRMMHLPCRTVHSPTGFTSQQKPSNVELPPSPTALQYAASKHLTTIVSSLMQQYSAVSSTQGWSSSDRHTLSYVQTIPNHSTWLHDSFERHELAMVHIARALSLCRHKGWLDNIFRGNDVVGVMWFPAKMHVRACFKRDVRLLSPGFGAVCEFAMCCKLMALEKRKVLVALHLAYLRVNWHGINPHKGEQ